MLCLWLTQIYPVPADAGDLSYSLHLLRSLRRAGARVTVLSMRRSNEPHPGAPDSEIEWIVVPAPGREMGGRFTPRSLMSGLPNISARGATRAFRRALTHELSRPWDAIVVDHLAMGWSWPAISRFLQRTPDVVTVFIAHQCEGNVRRTMAQNFRGNILGRLVLAVDAEKAVRLERRLIAKASFFTTITPEDRQCFGGSRRSILISPGYAGHRVVRREITAATPKRALIFGSAIWLAKQMNLMEFIDAAATLFEERQIELWVIGRVSEQLRIAACYRAIRFLGYVDDPVPILATTRIGIVAERTGGGFKMKSLDYIFNRVPIAALAGSVAGLPLAPGADYLAFSTMEELVDGISAAIDDLELLNGLQTNAYEKCRSAFCWRERGEALLTAIKKAREGVSVEA